MKLGERLRSEPARFDFYQLVRLLLLERQPAAAGPAGPGLAARLGSVVRFRARLEQSFAAHEVWSARAPAPGSRTEIETGNYALAGATGPLPEALVEQMLERSRDKRESNDPDRGMEQFLDLFNHRINLVRYELKAGPRPGLGWTRPEESDLALMLRALIGFHGDDLWRQLQGAGAGERAWLAMAGLLANARHSAPVVTRILGALVGAKVALEPLVGAWRERQDGDRMAIGALGRNQVLGRSARLGTRAWMPAACVRLRVDPLPYDRYCALLPKRERAEVEAAGSPDEKAHVEERARAVLTRDAHPRLEALVRLLLDRRFDAWIELRLDGPPPPPRLTAVPLDEHGRYGMRLGQTAWISGNQPPSRAAATSFLVTRSARRAS